MWRVVIGKGFVYIQGNPSHEFKKIEVESERKRRGGDVLIAEPALLRFRSLFSKLLSFG
jgi:hypothetical protein